jgi:hypothetical protein
MLTGRREGPRRARPRSNGFVMERAPVTLWDAGNPCRPAGLGRGITRPGPADLEPAVSVDGGAELGACASEPGRDPGAVFAVRDLVTSGTVR